MTICEKMEEHLYSFASQGLKNTIRGRQNEIVFVCGETAPERINNTKLIAYKIRCSSVLKAKPYIDA
jgi:hypothetical protein